MPSKLQPGETLGRYRLREELGQGGMATVYLAHDPALGRQVAIKVMHPHLWKQREYATRFAREARAVAALRHPHIVEIYDYSEGAAPADEVATPGYIVAELVQGPTLQAFLQAQGTPLPEVGAMIALILAEALGCAHGRGIIHRDLKPENVMIAEGGRIVLTDFGIARIVEGEAVTQTGALIGSPAYMAPEQARGAQIDARADLFSLGALLYQLCTGRLPFSGKDPLATVLKVLDGRYEPPLKLNACIGTDLDRLIRRLLQTDPEARPATADQVVAALRALLAARGLAQPEAELADYFRSPGEYNQQLRPRVRQAVLTGAREALSHRDIPQTLACCDYLLAAEPEHPEARAILKQLTSRRHWRRFVLQGVAAAFLLGAGGALLWSSMTAERAVRGDASLAEGGAGAAVLTGSIASTRDDAGAGAELRGASVAPEASGEASLSDAGLRAAARAPDLAADWFPPAPRPTSARLARTATVAPAAATVQEPPPVTPDAGISGSQAQADAATPRRSKTSSPEQARLLVAIGPWCEVQVDGQPAGLSPMQQPLLLEPGEHEVICRQGSSGPRTKQRVQLAPGELRRLGGLVIAEVRVSLRVAAGTAVEVDGRRYTQSFSIAPKRYRVDLIKNGKTVAGRWITIPVSGCTLVDQPELSCRQSGPGGASLRP